jgi:hypothetical protein
MRVARCIWVGCVALAASGCAGYKVGPTNGLASGEKSVQVAPFANQTLEPRLGDAMTRALRKELQRDGTYKVATHDAGDIVVSGAIVQYNRSAQSFVATDVITPRDYSVSLTAQVTARERASGKVVLDKAFTGHTLLRISTDLTSADREALPLLATDVARQVTASLADGGW